jgi:tetratricopeptide (TPR) repeat protein
LINPLVQLPVGSNPNKTFPDPLVMGRADLVYAAMDDAARRFKERKHPERVPSEVLYLRGMAAAHLERHTFAIRDIGALLERSMKLDTSTTLEAAPMRTNELRYILGTLYHRAGQLDRAKEMYRAAAEVDFGLYMAHVQLAGILVEEGKLDSAIIARRAAVDVNPDDSSVHMDLALTLLQAKRDAEAATSLLRAAELNPRDARVPYLLGMLSQAAGLSDEAKSYLQRFVAMAPERMADQVADARARLATLP